MKRFKLITVGLAFSLAIASAFASESYKVKTQVAQGFEDGNCGAGLQSVSDNNACNGTGDICRINGQSAYKSQAGCNAHNTSDLMRKI